MSCVLLLGGTGYVGDMFQHVLNQRNLRYLNVSRSDHDYYDMLLLRDIIESCDAEFVINAAGFTGKPNVDQCEIMRDETIRGNVLLPQIVAQACDLTDTPLVHVSSGCIYSGHKSVDAHGELVGFNEDDTPNFSFDQPPCSFYSGTKALSEQVLSQFERVYTCRLRIPFDHLDSPRNYLSKMQMYDKVYDATNSMSHREEFVQACLELALNRCEYGTYNVTNTGYVTSKQVVELIKQLLHVDREFEYWMGDQDFYSNGACTPRSNCVMDNTKLLSTGIDMRSVEEAILSSLQNWISVD